MLLRSLSYILLSLTGLLLLTFILLKAAPGNPEEIILSENLQFSESSLNDFKSIPAFYFSIQPFHESGIMHYVPNLNFNSQNSFHHWLFGTGSSSGILRGDFGKSIVTGEKVSSMIIPAFRWSLLITLLAGIFSFIFSTRIAIFMTLNNGNYKDHLLKILLNILYVTPAYWAATLLILFFANPAVLNILPSSGTGSLNYSDGFLSSIFSTIPYLILPTITLAYGHISSSGRILRNQMSDLLKEDFVLTARSKGLNEKEIIKKHVYKNALLPLIALYSHLFPFVIGGTVIIESIFSIPGMGQLLYRSIISRDYPVIIACFFLTGLVTIIGFRLAEVVYNYTDPRIKNKAKLS